MALTTEERAELRRDPAVRTVIGAWRELAGGRRSSDAQRRTLIACSGGVDSSALAIALAASVAPRRLADAPLILASIVHRGMRDDSDLEADRAAVAMLADRCGLPFDSSVIDLTGGSGNTEARARRGRYEALASLAAARGCGFIATGHQSDDQAETVLMRMFRGAGARGLSGIHRSRPLALPNAASTISIIRPMLAISRADAERICGRVTWIPRIDATNADTSFRRAAVRAVILPVIDATFPAASGNLGRLAEVMTSIAAVLDAHASELEQRATVRRDGAVMIFDRDLLRQQNPAVLGELLHRIVRRWRSGGLDRVTWIRLRPVIDAVTASDTNPKTLSLPGVVIRISAHAVELSAVQSNALDSGRL